MADFLEERLDHNKIRMGASFTEEYAVNVVQTSGGNEYRSLIHVYPRRTFDISQLLEKEETYNYVLALYHRAHGQYAGFRIRCYDEFSSNGATGTPTAFDQPMVLVSAGVYQLAKRYGTDKAAGATGYAYRLIKKPVSGTVLVGVGSTAIRSADWSVDTTTGRVTFGANVTRAINNITTGATTVIDVGSGHSFATGMSVQIDSTVNGMTQIRGLRGFITTTGTTTITVAINSTGFSAYTSGGTVNTRPQTGETVTCGYQFDFPVRFNGSMVVSQNYYGHRDANGIELVELLNP